MHDGSLPDARGGVAGDDQAGAGVPDQHLPTQVAMPEGPGSGGERHPVDAGARVAAADEFGGLDTVVAAAPPRAGTRAWRSISRPPKVKVIAGAASIT
jgi:hypothetical protein